jgi:hypothetical protein
MPMPRVFLIAVLVLAAIANAIEPSKGGPDVRFLAERAPADLGQVLLASAEGRSDPFDLPVNNLSAPKTPPAKVFSVWSVANNVSLASVALPEEGKSFIVLLIPSSKGGYSPVVMRSDDPSFKPGDIYFHNIADKTVLGFVGTAKFTLDPAKGTIVRPKGARDEKFYDVGLGVREKEGDRVLATTRWPEDSQSRFYVFFYLNPETKSISYRAVDEFVAKKIPVP